MSETKEGPNPWGQTGVVHSSGVSGIHTPREPSQFYKDLESLTWKDEQDKIWMANHANKSVTLLDGYKPVPAEYERLNNLVDFMRGRKWVG